MDDILIFADEVEIKRIEEFFKKEFTWIYDECRKCPVIPWHANYAETRSSDN
jgi:hypothetical protein